MTHAGRSIIETLWEQAVAQYGKLRELHEETHNGITADNIAEKLEEGADAEDAVAYLQQQGKLVGICYAISVMLNPYEPDLEAVKAQVREQWAAANEEEDD